MGAGVRVQGTIKLVVNMRTAPTAAAQLSPATSRGAASASASAPAPGSLQDPPQFPSLGSGSVTKSAVDLGFVSREGQAETVPSTGAVSAGAVPDTVQPHAAGGTVVVSGPKNLRKVIAPSVLDMAVIGGTLFVLLAGLKATQPMLIRRSASGLFESCIIPSQFKSSSCAARR